MDGSGGIAVEDGEEEMKHWHEEYVVEDFKKDLEDNKRSG